MLHRFLSLLLLASAWPVCAAAQSEWIRPTDNLVVEGVPPIPSSLADEVRYYNDLRPSGLRGWHPVQRTMLIGRRVEQVSQVFDVASPGATPKQITNFAESLDGTSYFPADPGTLLLVKDFNGNENYQFYRYSIATRDTVLLTDGKSRHTSPRFSHTGGKLVYMSTKRTGRDADVYIMDPTRPASERRLAELEGAGWGVADWSRDESTLLLHQFISAAESYLWLLDVATGTKRLLVAKPTQGRDAFGGAQFSVDGRTVYATTTRGSDMQRLVRIDRASGSITPMMPELTWELERFELSFDGTTIAYIVNEAGLSRLGLIDVASGRELPAPKLPPGVLFGLEWRRGAREIAFTFNSAQSPSDVWSYDLEAQALSRWTTTDLGAREASSFPVPELIRWKSFDSLEITGFMTRPARSHPGRRPVVISIHGGPASQWRPTFLGRWNYLLNDLGVVIIAPNIRGSSGFGEKFEQLDNGYLRENSVKDIGALLDWIAKQPDLDPQRVMVTGGSYGGYMSLAVSVHYAERIRCAVDIVGISNYVTFLTNTADYRRDLRRVEYGDERDTAMRAFLQRISPLTNAEKIVKPIFIVQGANDPRVPLTEAEQMVRRLRAIGTPVWYLMAKDEGHGFSRRSNQEFEFYATVMFMRSHLLGN